MPAYMTGYAGGAHHETEVRDEDDEEDEEGVNDNGNEKKVTMTIESTNIRNTG